MDVLSKYYSYLGPTVSLLVSVLIAKKVVDFVRDILHHCFGGVFLKKRLHKFGKYAIVTGCTRGLGLEFCRQLAEKEINLIMIARNKTEVEKLASEIRTLYNVQVHPVVMDLSASEMNDYQLKELDQFDVGILINNAGIMYDYPDYFHNISDKVISNIVDVNITASQMLAHYVLQRHFVPKKKGLLVFLSSSACYQLTPMMTCYSASKKYIEYMGKCLRCEYGDYDIFIQTLLPYYIATDMTRYSDALNKPSLLSPSAETYVRHALRTFGFAHETTGYLPHTIMLWCSSLIVERVWVFFAIPLMRYFKKSGEIKKH